MTVDLEKTTTFIRKLLPQAGKILLGYFGLTGLRVQRKGKIDIVTEADLKVDKFLQTEIKKVYPKIPFLTEETAPDNFSNLEKEEFLWVIDPLDGTVNFQRGSTNFAISVALINYGKSVLGMIYTPFFKKMYWTNDNMNKALLNGKPISVSKVDKISKASFGIDYVYDSKIREKTIEKSKFIIPAVRQVKTMGSAVSDLCSLAEGKLDIYLNYGGKPWDWAAAYLITKKALGKTTTLEGKEWKVFNTEFILATNGRLHKDALRLLK